MNSLFSCLCLNLYDACRSVEDVKHLFKTLTIRFGSKWWFSSTLFQIPPENYLIISVSISCPTFSPNPFVFAKSSNRHFCLYLCCRTKGTCVWPSLTVLMYWTDLQSYLEVPTPEMKSYQERSNIKF